MSTEAESTELFLESLTELAHRRGPAVEQPNAHAVARNPLCGDQVAVVLRIADAQIAALAFEVRGCLLCEAAAGALRQHGVGRRLDDLEQAERFLLDTAQGDAVAVPADWSTLAVFAPLQSFPGRLKCVLLPLQALRLAFARQSPDADDSGAPIRPW